MISDNLDKFVADWVEVLWGYVPETRLRECFVKAYRQHKPNSFFEVSAICREWDKEKALGISPQADSNCSLCRAHDESAKWPEPVAPCPFHQSTQEEVLKL